MAELLPLLRRNLRVHAGYWLVCSAAASAGCGAAPSYPRDYAFEESGLNAGGDAPEPLLGWPAQVQDDRVEAAPPRDRPARTRPTIAASPGGSWPQRHAQPKELPSEISPPAPMPEPARTPAEAAPTQQPAAPANARPPQNDEELRATQRVEAAQALLGTPGLQDRAFVAQVLKAAGQDVQVEARGPYAAALWAKLTGGNGKVADGETRPGDLIFFRDTADLNGNGRPDDGVTLVGVVERVRGAHVVLIAQRAGKVRRMAVDPTRPQVIRDAAGEVINTRLVRWPSSNEVWTTGQCLVGYARPK
ncbi:MAG: hypothetical protein HY902_12035 [Deltaproteobacteria bacterium]|nr:hypothetical protein [Deltaproteobacteria bacterium]